MLRDDDVTIFEEMRLCEEIKLWRVRLVSNYGESGVERLLRCIRVVLSAQDLMKIHSISPWKENKPGSCPAQRPSPTQARSASRSAGDCSRVPFLIQLFSQEQKLSLTNEC